MEGLDTESKNGRMELEEGISSCRILFQEGSIGNSYWADTYFLLNSFISTEHGLFQSKPHNSQFETGYLLHCTHLQHALCTTTPTTVFLCQWQLSEQIRFMCFTVKISHNPGIANVRPATKNSGVRSAILSSASLKISLCPKYSMWSPSCIHHWLGLCSIWLFSQVFQICCVLAS